MAILGISRVHELVQQTALAVNAGIFRNQNFGQFAMVLGIKGIEDFFHAACMGLGGAEEDGLTRQDAIGIFDAFLHEFLDNQRIGPLVDDLLFELTAFEVYFFNVLCLSG